MEVLLLSRSCNHLKNGTVKWYSTYYHQCLKAPPIDYYTSNGNGIARTAMIMMPVLVGGLYISTPSNILGTTDGRNLIF
jgi:hypothetical protein